MVKRYSVIIPHYNDVERLARMLKSIPVGRADIEVVVVDDCSTCLGGISTASAGWPQVRWLSTSKNSGAGVARNIGLDAATGDWLVFADSDDEFIGGAFDTFDQVLRDGDELVYFLAESVQETDGSQSSSVDGLNALVLACSEGFAKKNRQQLRLQHVVPWAKVYSRSYVNSTGVRFDSVQFGNDVAFNVLAAVQAERVRVVPSMVYRYYRRQNSLTFDLGKEAFLSRFSLAVSLAERLATNGLYRVRPATGYMLRAFKYGPRVVLYVWSTAIRSPMSIEWLRLFQFGRWVRFWSAQRAEARERERLDGGEQHTDSVSDGS